MVAAVALLVGCSAENSDPTEAEDKIKSGVLTHNMDTSVKPGEDFFAYVNGTWLNSYVMPDDKARFGTFNMLREQSQDAVKAIIEESAQGNNAPGSNEQKVGDLYNSYMDMATRNEVGTAPLMKIFAELDTLADHHELGAYFGRSIRAGFGAPFRFFINGDADDPTVYSVYTGQSGLGLRDREYYLKTDDKSVEIRAKYLDHVEKMLGLVGMENAGQNAAAIMALETKLATVMSCPMTRPDLVPSICCGNNLRMP